LANLPILIGPTMTLLGLIRADLQMNNPVQPQTAMQSFSFCF